MSLHSSMDKRVSFVYVDFVSLNSGKQFIVQAHPGNIYVLENRFWSLFIYSTVLDGIY